MLRGEVELLKLCNQDFQRRIQVNAPTRGSERLKYTWPDTVIVQLRTGSNFSTTEITTSEESLTTFMWEPKNKTLHYTMPFNQGILHMFSYIQHLFQLTKSRSAWCKRIISWNTSEESLKLRLLRELREHYPYREGQGLRDMKYF